MVLETKRLILRPWEDSDAEELYKYAKDMRVGPAAGWQPHTSVAESRDIIHNVLSGPEDYAVVLKSTGKAVGCISIMVPEKGSMQRKTGVNEMEIGYWIGVPYWGQGLIPEAVCRLQRRCFEDLGCTAIWCGYFDGNEKSKRVQEKCGFVYHHTEKDKKCSMLDEVRTEHFMYLTKDDWIKKEVSTIAK